MTWLNFLAEIEGQKISLIKSTVDCYRFFLRGKWSFCEMLQIIDPKIRHGN